MSLVTGGTWDSWQWSSLPMATQMVKAELGVVGFLVHQTVWDILEGFVGEQVSLLVFSFILKGTVSFFVWGWGLHRHPAQGSRTVLLIHLKSRVIYKDSSFPESDNICSLSSKMQAVYFSSHTKISYDLFSLFFYFFLVLFLMSLIIFLPPMKAILISWKQLKFYVPTFLY